MDQHGSFIDCPFLENNCIQLCKGRYIIKKNNQGLLLKVWPNFCGIHLNAFQSQKGIADPFNQVLL